MPLRTRAAEGTLTQAVLHVRSGYLPTTPSPKYAQNAL